MSETETAPAATSIAASEAFGAPESSPVDHADDVAETTCGASEAASHGANTKVPSAKHRLLRIGRSPRAFLSHPTDNEGQRPSWFSSLSPRPLLARLVLPPPPLPNRSRNSGRPGSVGKHDDPNVLRSVRTSNDASDGAEEVCHGISNKKSLRREAMAKIRLVKSLSFLRIAHPEKTTPASSSVEASGVVVAVGGRSAATNSDQVVRASETTTSESTDDDDESSSVRSSTGRCGNIEEGVGLIVTQTLFLSPNEEENTRDEQDVEVQIVTMSRKGDNEERKDDEIGCVNEARDDATPYRNKSDFSVLTMPTPSETASGTNLQNSNAEEAGQKATMVAGAFYLPQGESIEVFDPAFTSTERGTLQSESNEETMATEATSTVVPARETDEHFLKTYTEISGMGDDLGVEAALQDSMAGVYSKVANQTKTATASTQADDPDPEASEIELARGNSITFGLKSAYEHKADCVSNFNRRCKLSGAESQVACGSDRSMSRGMNSTGRSERSPPRTLFQFDHSLSSDLTSSCFGSRAGTETSATSASNSEIQEDSKRDGGDNVTGSESSSLAGIDSAPTGSSSQSGHTSAFGGKNAFLSGESRLTSESSSGSSASARKGVTSQLSEDSAAQAAYEGIVSFESHPIEEEEEEDSSSANVMRYSVAFGPFEISYYPTGQTKKHRWTIFETHSR